MAPSALEVVDTEESVDSVAAELNLDVSSEAVAVVSELPLLSGRYHKYCVVVWPFESVVTTVVLGCTSNSAVVVAVSEPTTLLVCTKDAVFDDSVTALTTLLV